MDGVDESLVEGPVCWSVRTEKIGDVCSFCLKSDPSLLRCSKCKFLCYCSKDCQRNDWSEHKVECRRILSSQTTMTNPEYAQKIKEISSSFPNDGLRLVARIWTKVEKGETMESGGRSFDDLVSHADDIFNPGDPESDSSREFISFCTLFLVFTGGQEFDQTELLEVYGRVKVNAFEMKNEALRSVGVGLYLSLSRLDHSCHPIGRIIFRGKYAVVVPTRKERFESPPVWKAIQHSYIENLMGLNERRLKLETDYFFLCQCRGCVNNRRNRKMGALACESSECGGAAVPAGESQETEEFVCDKCGVALTEAPTARMIAEMTQQVLRNLDAHADLPPTDRLELAAKTATAQEGTLHRHNIDHMRTLRHAYEAAVALNNWQHAATLYGKRVLHTYEQYLGRWDPWLGVFRRNLAHVYLNWGTDEGKEEGKRLLQEAKPVLEHAFGKSSATVANVNAVLQKLD